MQQLVQAPRQPTTSGVRTQLVILWITPVVGAVFLIAFLAFPGFFPPTSPRLTAEQVAAFYAHHTTMLRFSMIVFNLFGISLVPFFSLIVVQMKRMSTPTQILAYGYLNAVISGAALFALADLFWLIAAFRPDRNPELTQLLNDLAWITFIAPVGFLVVQCLCLAAAVYLDAHPRPVFPRWVAPFNIATALAILPSALAATVTTGPLAWNGAISFYLRISALAVYIAVMFFVVRAAVIRQSAEEQDEAVQP
jgi:hypothetical protein